MSKHTDKSVRVSNFHYSPYGGIRQGIPLIDDMPNLRNNGRNFPSHVRCGERFLALNYKDRPATRFIEDASRVMDADVFSITPAEGSPFDVLSKGTGDSVLIYVETKPNDRRIKEKNLGVDVREGVMVDDGGKLVMYSRENGQFLIQLRSGQGAYIFMRNGLVTRIDVHGGNVIESKLDFITMARLHVERLESEINFQENLEDENERRLHGILGSAVRLLNNSLRRPEVRRVFVGFLVEHADRLPKSFRETVRTSLLSVGDMYAGNFVEGWDGNVISLTQGKTGVISDKLKEANTRRSLRRENDRQMRSRMKGSSNGGSKKKVAEKA